MKDNGKLTSTGMSLSSTLLVILICLRLTGVIDWPWYLVLLPVWIDIAIVLVVAFILVVMPKLIKFFKEIYR